MATPSIRIDGSTTGAGATGTSRDDLVTTETLDFTDTANGSGTVFTLIAQPFGSAKSLTGAGQTRSIAPPTLPGRYIVKCENAGLESGTTNATTGEFDSIQGGAGIKFTNGLLAPSVRETRQGDATHGWAKYIYQTIEDVDEVATPLTTPTAGDLAIGNATPAWAKLAIGTTNQLLAVSGGLPAWTGSIQLDAGLQATPSVAVGEADTGLYRPGVGQLAITLADDTVANFTTTLFDLQNGMAIQFLEVAAVPGGSPAATRGKLWVRNDGPNVLVFTDDIGGDTVLGSGGGGSLDDAYNVGSTVTVDAAAVTLQNTGTETIAMLVINKSPSAPSVGEAIQITMGAASTGRAIDINSDGSNDALFIDKTPASPLGGHAIDIEFGANTTQIPIQLDNQSTTNNPALSIRHRGTGQNQSVLSLQSGSSASAITILSEGGSTFGGGVTYTTGGTTGGGTAFAATYSSNSTAGTGISINKSHGGSTGGNGGTFTLNTNCTGVGLQVTNSGTGTSLAITHNPASADSDALNIALSNSTLAQAIAITTTSTTNAARPTVHIDQQSGLGAQYLLHLEKTPSGSAAGGCLDIDMNVNTTGDAIRIVNLGSGTSIVSDGVSVMTLTQTVATTGSPTMLTMTGAAHTTLANAETTDVNIDLSRTVQFAGSATLANQRAMVIDNPTYASDTATKTLTRTSTVSITGAPQAGTNVAITEAFALEVLGLTNVQVDAVGETSTDADIGLQLVNRTTATGGNEQWSPMLVFEGQADDTGSTTGRWAIQNQVNEPGDADIDPTLHFLSDSGTGTFASVFRINEAGGIVSSAGGIFAAGVDISLSASVPGLNISQSGSGDALQLSGTVLLDGNQSVATSGNPTMVAWTGGAHTTLTLSTEAEDIFIDLNRAVQWSTGALATQRAIRIAGPTYAFVGASTLTTAATFDIDKSPQAGTLATITTSSAARIANATTLASATAVRTFAINVPDHTVTLTGTTQMTGSPGVAGIHIGAVTVANASAQTIDVAAGLYIANEPVVSGSAVITNSYALFVDAGLSRFDGDGTDVFELPVDNTDPTSGGGAAFGRVPIRIGGATRFLAYY